MNLPPLNLATNANSAATGGTSMLDGSGMVINFGGASPSGTLPGWVLAVLVLGGVYLWKRG